MLFVLVLLENTLYYSGDTTFHINRIVGIADAFRDGQLIPRMYPYTNNGFGYPVSLFYCDLFIYPFSILYMLGLPLVITYKVMLIFYVSLGTILMYIVSRIIFKDDNKTLLCLALYCFNNYRFINFYPRGAFGELLGFTFFPLILLVFYRMFIQKKQSYVLLGVSMGIMCLAHNMSFLFYVILYIMFSVIHIILNIKDVILIRKFIVDSLLGALIALGISAWYLFPYIELLNTQELYINNSSLFFDLNDTLLNIDNYLEVFVNYTNNFTIHTINDNSVNIFFLLIPMFIIFVKHKNKYLIYLTVIYYFMIFTTMGYTYIHNYSFTSILQYSNRLFAIITPIGIIIITYILSKTNKLISYSLIIFCILNHCLGTYQYFNIRDSRLNDNQLYNQILEENLNYDRDHNEKQMSDGLMLPTSEKNNYLTDTTYIKLLENNLYSDIIYDFNRNFTHIDFEYKSKGKEVLMLPLTYYKGYKAYAVVEDKRIELDVINTEVYKRVGITTLEGDAHYYIEYDKTLVQIMSYFISGITCIIVLFILYKNNKLNL